MDYNELKHQMDMLETELKKSSPKYRFFRTEVGKRFENQFKELMNFTNISNLLSNIPTFYTLFFMFMDDFQFEDFIPYQTKLSKDIPLSPSEQADALKRITDTLIQVLETFETDPESKKIVTNYMERINSYFFLAFYAYLDAYIDSLYEFLESKMDSDKFIKLKSKFERKKYKNDQINAIKNSLSLLSTESLGRILKGRTWKESFDTLIDRRHFMAHEDPKARYEMLTGKFEKVTKKVDMKIFKVPEQFASRFTQIKSVKKIQEEMKVNTLILLTLFEIGKDCYSYLAMIDILVDDYIIRETR